MANEAPPQSTVHGLREPSEFKGNARFEVLGCLGRGGMGVVYEVFDKKQRERVALKTLLHFDAAGLYRFKQEFRTLADVLHPNLVHLHELMAGEGDDVLFTMELVEGTDFLGHVQKAGTPRVPENTRVVSINTGVRAARNAEGRVVVTSIDSEPPRSFSPANFDRLRPAFRQLVEGLRALHGAGKLHRDIKPSNVRVTPEGRVVILDFGVATELRRRARPDGDEEIVGTVAYMAPEQAMGDAAVAASDWYSVGALLYEALTGQPPFNGAAMEVLTLKATVMPPAPASFVGGLPDDLNNLCMALLAIDPEERPTAGEILRRLGATGWSDQAPAPRVPDGPETTPLFGREPQLAELRSAFTATAEGRAVAVRVSGLFGLGKSALANHFLDEIEAGAEVVVLRGRAYERETVPYKAVDSIVDALTRHLIDMQDADVPIELPEEIWALAHVFPVLRRVQKINEVASSPVGDPQVIRLRAFAALREMLATLSRRQRVVVFIDDVQWGDADSAALLVELMRPPVAPPLLLLTTHRSEDEKASPFLAEQRARWPEDAEVRDVSVGPLGADDGRRLALALLGSSDASAQRTADGIASESGGSPFLIEELARGASAYHRVAAGELFASRAAHTLEEMIAARAARLPPHARRFLEVVAVGGRPMPVPTVAVAAEAEEQPNQLVALLRTRRFVRAGLRDGRETVEVSHDRIRQTIVAQLPPEVARDHHARIARVLETSPSPDPEAIASHLLGAGDTERAARYAEQAAEQAVTKLAFAQAARLFQLALDTVGKGSPEAARLARRTAEAAEWAGHSEKAARAYLVAAEAATSLERIDLERAAAVQLVAAGLIDEGEAVCRRVLAAVGRKAPTAPIVTILWALFYRFASGLVARRELKDARELTRVEVVRLEALHAIQRVLSVVDPILVMYVKARYLFDALRAGSRVHVVRAAVAEASTLSGHGGPVGARERRLYEMALRISKESGDAVSHGLYLVTYGIGQYLRGHWRAAVDLLDPAVAKLAAARRWNANAAVYATYATAWLGDMREVKARTLRLLADAEQRGDLYTAVNLRASHPTGAWLAADDVEGARRHVRDAMALWSKTRYLVQHWQAMLWESEIDLYAGEGERAWDRLRRDERALRRSRMVRWTQLIRVLTFFMRGRAAIGSLATLAVGLRAGRIAEARRAQRQLAKERLPWTLPLSEILVACVARASGNDAEAEGALRRSISLAQAAEMVLFAAAARRQLGTLVGGKAGSELVSEADEAMKARGVRIPERYAGWLVPGTWPRDPR